MVGRPYVLLSSFWHLDSNLLGGQAEPWQKYVIGVILDWTDKIDSGILHGAGRGSKSAKFGLIFRPKSPLGTLVSKWSNISEIWNMHMSAGD